MKKCLLYAYLTGADILWANCGKYENIILVSTAIVLVISQITLPQPGSFSGWGMLLCAVAKGVMRMQKQLLTSGNTFKRTDGRWNGVVWYMDEQGQRGKKITRGSQGNFETKQAPFW